APKAMLSRSGDGCRFSLSMTNRAFLMLASRRPAGRLLIHHHLVLMCQKRELLLICDHPAQASFLISHPCLGTGARPGDRLKNMVTWHRRPRLFRRTLFPGRTRASRCLWRLGILGLIRFQQPQRNREPFFPGIK